MQSSILVNPYNLGLYNSCFSFMPAVPWMMTGHIIFKSQSGFAVVAVIYKPQLFFPFGLFLFGFHYLLFYRFHNKSKFYKNHKNY